MGSVVLVISVSVDGFVAADNVRVEAPMGDGGDRLHRWLMDAEDPRNREILTRGIGSLGAVITGTAQLRDVHSVVGRQTVRQGRRACPCSCSRTASPTSRRRTACTRSSRGSTERWRRRERQRATK